MDRDDTSSNEVSIFIAPPFDLLRSPTERAVSLAILCEDAAKRSMLRDEQMFPEEPFPWTPNVALMSQDGSYQISPAVVRSQEEKRRAYQILVDLEIAAHRAQAAWEISNQDEAWLDENGAAVTLAEVIERMLPGEEERASSGRARQKAAFPKAAKAMQEAGVPLETIVRCADTGKSSVLGIVASAQKKLAKTEPDPEALREKYEALIDMASKEQTMADLEENVARLANPTLPEPPKIEYYVVPGDDEEMWVVLRIEEPDLRRLFFKRLGDVLVLVAKDLMESFRNVMRRKV